jgi:phage FluMu protein Com
MAAVILYCAKCNEPYAPDGPVEIVCPSCKEITTWSTAEPYHVTEMDARFLASIKIRTER